MRIHKFISKVINETLSLIKRYKSLKNIIISKNNRGIPSEYRRSTPILVGVKDYDANTSL